MPLHNFIKETHSHSILFRSCHFYGGVGKLVWLYLPILLLLFINTAMFVFIAVNIFKNQ